MTTEPTEGRWVARDDLDNLLAAIDPDIINEALIDAQIQTMYATCPYRLKNGEQGAYGPNTCHGGCSEEPECVTGGPYEEEDEGTAIKDAVVSEVRWALDAITHDPNESVSVAECDRRVQAERDRCLAWVEQRCSVLRPPLESRTTWQAASKAMRKALAVDIATHIKSGEQPWAAAGIESGEPADA